MRGFSTLWNGNAEFQNDLIAFLAKPFIKEPLFELHRCIGVWSREGNDTANVVVRFCKDHGIPVSDPPQKVEFSNSRAIMDFLVAFREASTPCAEGERYVLVIDNADILAYEPDSEDVMRFFMHIRDYATKLNIQIVFCFDRPPNWVEPGSTQKTFRFYFGSQITASTFLPAPDVQTRDLLFRECAELYEKSSSAVPAEGGHGLSDADFIFLASHSQFATCRQIVEFFKRCVIAAGYPVELKFDMFRSRMHEPRTGRPHILAIDVCGVEDKMSLACGKGPQQYDKVVTSTPTMAEDNEVRLRAMTKMTAKNVSIQAAKEELEASQAGVKREREEGEENVDIFKEPKTE